MTSNEKTTTTPAWTTVAPLVALAGVAICQHDAGAAPWVMLLSVPVLFAAVFAAVHHAESVAHRLGQPFGSILLALAVTLIEVSLAVLALVLPNYTLAVPGPVYAPSQLIFVTVVLLALYGFFLYSQTVSHREDYAEPDHADHVSITVDRRTFLLALVLLPLSLAAVVPMA